MKNLFNPVWISVFITFLCLMPFTAQAEGYLYDGTKPKVVIDVRTAEEFASGHIKGAINISYEQIAEGIKLIPGLKKDDSILLYCRSGHRAGIAKQTLENLGFQKIQNGGGMEGLAQKLRVCKEENC